MALLPQLYKDSLSLLTDLYELTMAYGYWKHGEAEREAVFHLTFRENPFGGQFAVSCGLSYVTDLLNNFRFQEDDLQYLATLAGGDGSPLFEPAFLDYLREMRFCCDVDAIPEGVAVFPREPLIRVCGPLAQSQIIETPLLTIINFQTLIATKAARVCGAARGQPVLEFGLRRAQGVDGGLAASRAAFVGGCSATSNVLAGKLFGIPVRGTHAHSWVMSFDNELQSFRAYAQAMPNNCVFLVDTYDTLAGVRNAVTVGDELRRAGHEMLGVRLDSGDLAKLSRQTRELLDKAGFGEAAIVASNDLDEYRIQQLHQQGAAINVWGVGTRLATAHDQPALGGVYKLAALRADDDRWRYKIKLSEQTVKASEPGVLQVRRYRDEGRFWGDVIYDEPTGIADRPSVFEASSQRNVEPPASADHEDMLIPVFRSGRLVYSPPSAVDAQQVCREQLGMLEESVKRLDQAEPYRVAIEERLWRLKVELMRAARTPRDVGSGE